MNKTLSALHVTGGIFLGLFLLFGYMFAPSCSRDREASQVMCKDGKIRSFEDFPISGPLSDDALSQDFRNNWTTKEFQLFCDESLSADSVTENTEKNYSVKSACKETVDGSEDYYKLWWLKFAIPFLVLYFVIPKAIVFIVRKIK